MKKMMNMHNPTFQDIKNSKVGSVGNILVL